MIRLPSHSQCADCVHFKGVTGGDELNEGFHCAAFDRIPESVILNKQDHSEPIEGDGGIQREVAGSGD